MDKGSRGERRTSLAKVKVVKKTQKNVNGWFGRGMS